ncbi:MAG TPA: alpha/beta hydrolase [Ktedonobacteraceae bacterium]|nr:alpha/beta hydrolase [Ktedonobacteraceae bacterium]
MTSDEASIIAVSVDNVERVLNVRGIQTHIFEAGTPAVVPLLYLHDIFLGNLWLEFHNILAQNFHVFAPDIPGFGLTERPNWMRDMSDYILYVRDLLDTLGLQKAIVIGHSLGGWIATELAVWYPERIEKLVLSNSAGIRVKGTPIADLFAMNPQEFVMACFDNPAAAMPLMPKEFNTDYLLSQYRQLTTLASLAWNPSYDPTLERRLERISCPTLIVWGQTDHFIPQIYGETLHRLIAHSELIQLEGTGHMPMFEKPVEWCSVISEFLQK